MGTRVWAFIELGPWDEEALKSTVPGRELLDAIEGLRLDLHEVREQGGVTIFYAEHPEVNYGTERFSQEGLHALAVDAGLWWAWGTDGGGSWEPSHEVGSPDGTRWGFMGRYGEACVNAADIAKIEAEVGDDPATVLAAIKEGLALGNKPLAEWIVGEAEKEGAA